MKYTGILTFLRLVDAHDGNLSLTNLAVIITLAKLAIAPVTSFVDVGTLFIALASYSYKKVVNKDVQAQVETSNDELNSLKSKLDEVESKVSAISIATGIRPLGKR